MVSKQFKVSYDKTEIAFIDMVTVRELQAQTARTIFV